MNQRIVILQNQITPYRSIVFNELAKTYNNNLLIIYCNKVENNRKWVIEELGHNFVFLKRSHVRFKSNYIYINLDVFKVLHNFKPDIIVTYGFNPVMLFAWIYSMVFGKHHFVLTDSWILTINKLSYIHRLVRRIVFKRTSRFICVGKKGIEYLMRYGVPGKNIYISQLVADVNYYRGFINTGKKYDLVFSGRFVAIKMPFFVIDVVKQIKNSRPDISILLIGSGELENEIINQLTQNNITYNYPGFIQQIDLPQYYASARLLLFPSEQDPWGLVANEACAVGVPVVTCDNTGVGGDLIIHDYNGYVLPLEVDIWAKQIINILENKELYDRLSKNAIKSSNTFTPEIAAKGICDAADSVS